MNKRGFTLIEILISVAIIAILTAIGVVSYTSINKRSRDAKRISDLEQVRSALEMYRSDNGSYPGTSASFQTLSTLNASLVPTYLPSIPSDPKSSPQVVVPYYFSPTGSGPPYYGYCICGTVEAVNAKNDCSGVTLPANCSYGLRNP